MKTTFRTLVLASAAIAATALSTIPAMASTSTNLKVPFSFTVNGRVLPAGDYSVIRETHGSFVTLKSKDASKSYVWVTSQADGPTDLVVLTFDAAKDTHVLRSIQYGAFMTRQLDKKSDRHEDVAPQYVVGQ